MIYRQYTARVVSRNGVQQNVDIRARDENHARELLARRYPASTIAWVI